MSALVALLWQAQWRQAKLKDILDMYVLVGSQKKRSEVEGEEFIQIERREREEREKEREKKKGGGGGGGAACWESEDDVPRV